jgi:radical SAM superfamily enzyme YgiQ (UPF0313 family)
MANICIARVRSSHEVVWHVPPLLRSSARALRWGYGDRVLGSIDGKPFLAQLTAWYLAALGGSGVAPAGPFACFLGAGGPRVGDPLADRTDVAMFTVNTPAAPATYRVADRLRREGVQVVLGGIHPTMLPDEAARHADSVVLGEAETVMDQILDDIARTGRPRPFYRGTPCESLAGLPPPRWPIPPAQDVCPWCIPVQTSRGCRNACSFCSTTRHQGAQRRHRPVEEIVAEIRGYQESGLLTPDKGLFFTDNNVVSDSDHRRGIRDTSYARSLFRALAPLGITWSGQGEITVGDDPELCDLMARSGCRTLLVGFESLDQANLQAVGKSQMHVEDYARRIEALHRRDILLIGCFILGLDHDTPAVFDQTADYILEHIDIPQVSVMTPFPGTALYRRLEREGRILHRDWSLYDITHVVFRPARMSPGELEAGYRHVNERVFAWPRMLGRATRAAARALGAGVRGGDLVDRWLSAFAANLVYRSLVRVHPGPEDESEALPEPQRSRPAPPPSLPIAA